MLNGNVIRNNTASILGGGLYVQFGNVALVNNAIVGNTGGGGVISRASSRLLHNTIARNIGHNKEGISIGGGSTVALTNTIVVNQAVGINMATGSTVTLNGVLWYSNTTNVGGEGIIAVTNEYTGNPSFASDGYHLTENSKAIDKGVISWVGSDIDNEPRPQQVPDLGADEYWVPGLLRYIYLPLIVQSF